MATENIRINYKVDKKQLEASNNELKKATKGNKLTQKEVDKTTKKFKNQEKTLAKTNKAFAGLGGQLTAIGNRFQVAGKGAGDMAAGLLSTGTAASGLSKALKILKVALISTGIGAIVVALGSLIAYFTRTQRGADKVSQVMAALGAVVDVIIDRLSILGEKLIGVFEDPQEALNTFVESIKTNLINRFVGLLQLLPEIGKAIKQVFSGEFALAAETAGDAVLKVVTGIEDFTSKTQTFIEDTKKGINDLVGEMIEEGRAATSLEKRRQKLRDAEIAFIVTKAKLRKEIAASRLAVEQEQLAGETLAESNRRRFEAAQVGIEAQNKLSEIEIALAKEKADILKAQLALGENLEADERELAETTAAIIDLETQRDEVLKRLITRQNAFNESVKAGTDAQEEALEADIAAAVEGADAVIDQIHRKEAAEVEAHLAREKRAAEEKQLAEEVASTKKEAALQSLEFIKNLVNKESGLAKAASIAQIGISSRKGAVAALEPPPIGAGPVLGPILAGLTIAYGAQQAARVAGLTPRFEKGGRIGGNLHSNGGTLIEAEKDEFVMSRKATAKYGFDMMDKINNLELKELPKGDDRAVIINNDTNPIAQQLKKMPQNVINIDSEGFVLHQKRGQDIINQKISRYST